MEDATNDAAIAHVHVQAGDGAGNFNLDVPVVDMIFNLEEKVKALYKKYASRMGFEFTVRNSRFDPDGSLNYMLLTCSREGNRASKIPKGMRQHPTIQSNCQARISTNKINNGTWSITKVLLDHNHEVSPTKSRLLNMNKKISLHVKRTIELNDSSGVRISKTFQTLVFDERDVRNYINRQRRAIGQGGDAKTLLDYFCKMKAENEDFLYKIDLDNEFHVRNIFWADARSRAAYQYFGDVVSFDTTYLTNKYDILFTAFVGVNHHGQYVLLGCGMLSGEATGSFILLFDSWVRCMLNKASSGIVTDQCRAMQKALETVMPQTRHRWCLWHVMKKILEKLKGYAEDQKNLRFNLYT